MAQARPTRIQHQVNPANSIDDSSSEYEGSDEISKGELGDKDSEAEASVRRNNPKEWYQPDIESGTHVKFIDHGTTIDENGYPLHPKGRTTFVHLPTDEIGNFGKVGFSKHSAISYAGANRTWKITRYFCLGVLTCDNTACTWAGSPPTCWKKWKHLPK
ncbi:hypothetical protein MJO28_001431, partial [Puccinia striiformis f. sp. tritici]